MNIVHLTASPFFGGPERQMLGLALALPDEYRSIFLSYSERGLCRPFLEQLRRHGFEAIELRHNAPRLKAAVRELVDCLGDFRADVLCCHGYKPDILGLMAARRLGVPVVAVSRGWTAATLKVRFYDWLDRFSLHAMDRVVCVSMGQADKVRRLGVPAGRIRVIHNAIAIERFAQADPACRRELEHLFPVKPRWIIGAAGRLSPEKGFAVLVDAARALVATHPEAGFVLFGDGPLHSELTRQIVAQRLEKNFIMPGFRADLDDFLPSFDLVALPSFTEGMPNIVLEAFAARLPVVATAVGGTPEIIDEGESGYLVPPGNGAGLAKKIAAVLASDTRRRAMGLAGFARVREHFTFEAQSAQYQDLFGQLGQTSQGRKARRQARQRGPRSMRLH
jgi:glycosyltransferase involved in cell wall biosynthesis